MRGQAQAAELGANFAGGGPEVRSIADHGRAHSVDDRNGADGKSRCRQRARRSQATLEVGGGGAIAAADGAQSKMAATRGLGGLPAELPVGRHAAPILVAA